MWIRYFRLFLLYISRELPEGSVCFVSCTAGAGIWVGLATVGLGLPVNALVGWGWETRVTDWTGRIGIGN